MDIGTHRFDCKNKTYVMGILNVTPDSFSDGGKWKTVDLALKHTEKMISEGAAIIDIGGESTRPGYTQITQDEEIARTEPVVEQVKKHFDIPISIDTYKSEVAKAAIEAGADMVNDIWGLQYDSKMADVIARSGAACCLMHNRDLTSRPYCHFLKDVAEDLRKSIETAKHAGIADEKIILDPGVGFGKTYEHNLEIIRSLGTLQELDYPLLLGASRKSVIGITLGTPVEERLEGSLVTTVFAVLQHCAFVRVHDVKEHMRAIQMTQALCQNDTSFAIC